MKVNNEILLVQPRHIYAPDSTKSEIGHIYLPTSLLTIAAALLKLKVSVSMIDENIEHVEISTENIGLNLLGAPYIPTVKRFEKLLQNRFPNQYKLFIGGQVVNGLNEIDFNSLFGPQVINGNVDSNILNYFNIQSKFPDIYQLSLIPAIKLIPPQILNQYLKTEFGLFLSQGCKYSCTFCAANRTRIINGAKYVAKEKYRNINIVIQDLEYLILEAKNFGLGKINIYLSNLDLFQNSKMLLEFGKRVNVLKIKYNFDIIMRGLSTVASFLNTHNNNPEAINTIRKAGLERIGFGIDGATANVYKQTNKPQNVKMCLDSIKISREIYDITPEILMVFGHNDMEDETSLKMAYEFCEDMLDKYQALPRPHIAKDCVPGNDGWQSDNRIETKNLLFKNIDLFQNLDFTALPSSLTHPNNAFRSIVSDYYIKICSLPNSLTQYVLPITTDHEYGDLEFVSRFNCGRYDL